MSLLFVWIPCKFTDRDKSLYHVWPCCGTIPANASCLPIMAQTVQCQQLRHVHDIVSCEHGQAAFVQSQREEHDQDGQEHGTIRTNALFNTYHVLLIVMMNDGIKASSDIHVKCTHLPDMKKPHRILICTWNADLSIEPKVCQTWNSQWIC